jgi:hypothetical protein
MNSAEKSTAVPADFSRRKSQRVQRRLLKQLWMFFPDIFGVKKTDADFSQRSSDASSREIRNPLGRSLIEINCVEHVPKNSRLWCTSCLQSGFQLKKNLIEIVCVQLRLQRIAIKQRVWW